MEFIILIDDERSKKLLSDVCNLLKIDLKKNNKINQLVINFKDYNELKGEVLIN